MGYFSKRVKQNSREDTPSSRLFAISQRDKFKFTIFYNLIDLVDTYKPTWGDNISVFKSTQGKTQMKRSTYLKALAAGTLCIAGYVAAEIKPVASETAVSITAQLAYPIMLKSAEENYLKISLTGKALVERKRSPLNVALVIDRSGSMSGEKIQQARAAAELVVDMLAPQDMIAIIGYDSQAEVIVPATKISDKAALKGKIRRAIHPDGNTALFAGVSKGIRETQKFFDKNNVNRVILLSDGQANIGPSSTSELGELGKTAAKKGITVSTIGLGLGYNEDLMTALANYSDGNHVFVEHADKLTAVFQREFDDAMSVVAQNVRINIALKNAKPLRLLGREGDIRGNRVEVGLKQIYAEREKYVLLAIAPTLEQRQGEQVIADVSVSYDTENREAITAKRQVKLLYSDSQETVNKAINEDVLADYYIQKSNAANEMAIKALDKGDTASANRILKAAADEVAGKISKFSSAPARAVMTKQTESLNDFAEQAVEAPEVQVRKSLKAYSYKTKKQQ
ncbi:MAG: hypothetical protein CR974_02850 [Gammaproteobacteria bacterium]|nr:MAG: hypothetical protein CR974_02850 [Gammaproteobacteria bacterium]